MISCISFLCPWPILLCAAPGLLPWIGAPLQTSWSLWQDPEALCRPHKLKDCFVKCPVFQGKLQSAALFGPFNMAAVTAVFPTSITLFWKGKLLPSSGFGKVAPFPGRSSNVKGAFCNETETEKSFIKVSVSLTPCAQEQVFWLLHSYPCQHW